MLPNIADIGRYAIFLDLDGTVVNLADCPDAVHVDISTLRLLKALSAKADRALAVISGRDIAVIDRLLSPLVLPVAGVHGLQRRDASGRLRQIAPEEPGLGAIALLIEEAIGDERGILIERKTGAVALHFRMRPELEERCRGIIETIARRRPDLRVVRGKMVFEIRRDGSDKGRVIDAFLREQPFFGRTPIFAGDDITDEVGFSVVNAREGISIKIGEGSTLARFRAESVREFRDWLDELAAETREWHAV
jgi:trehalose 6-phosphate phosphatase